jgi:hypothetical protein
MKQIILPAIASAFLLTACGNAKVKDAQKNEDGTTTTTTYDMNNLKKMSEGTDEMTKKTEELKKLTPLSLDQLKTLLPETLNGIKRTDYNANSSMGYAMVDGEYKKDDTTNLKVMLYDCAGEAGAGMYTLTYWSAMNFQQESEKEYTKTIDFKGAKAIENFKKDQNESSLTYFSNDRLLVVLNGRNMGPDALKQAAQSLDIKL